MNLLVALVLLPALCLAVPCTNSPSSTTPNPNTEGPTTDGGPEPTTDPSVDTTTEYIPPPTQWPTGRYTLLKAGSKCPQFATFKAGKRYQDTEDFRNANSWPAPTADNMPGPMKYDGITWNFCSKVNWKQGDYQWPEGNYCIHKQAGKCPTTDFEEGSILWDDENSFNANTKKGRMPIGVYDENTNMTFCCRADGSASVGISLPVTRPFYLYPYTDECQKVRGMDVQEEVIQFDDEDSDNQNNKVGAVPKNTGGATDHRLHFCLYTPK